MTPRVTVLLAVLNGGDYLREAVESTLSQTYRDFELLLVDDGSTDGAVAALPLDARVRVLRNEKNVGQVPSLNRGLREARGEYVARLDADDTMLPTRLERQVAVLDAEPRVALVGTWIDVVDEEGRPWAQLRGDIRDYVEFVAAIVRDRYPFGHPSLMYRRDVVLELGGYDVELAPSEDKDLYRRLALARHEARVVREPLTRYRRHAGQLSQIQTARQLRNDHLGQERFLAALAPDQPAGTVRRLLAADPTFWSEEPLESADLEALLVGAQKRLRLSDEERCEVGRVIAERCAQTLLVGWSTATPGYAARAAAPARFVASYGAASARATLALQWGIRLTKPLGPAAAAARRSVRQALRDERFAGLRAVARRSRTLRRLYARVLGFRLLDD